MEEPDNLVLALLREMRYDMNKKFNDLNDEMKSLSNQIKELDKKVENVKKAAFGESVMGRYIAAEVEERLEALEKRLQNLEQHH